MGTNPVSDAPKDAEDGPRTSRSAPSEAAIASFAVPTWMHRVAGWQERHPKGAIRLGNFDTRMAAEAIADKTVTAPIYIAGLARSGTTKLLELIAAHPDVGSHRYRDFPPVFTPWLWDRWLARVPQADETRAERAHGDGIEITSQSPEAFEEVLWMAFFENLHDPAHSNRLDRDASHPAFEPFYDAHIRKMLAVRDARRYVAKGNYNLMRLAYLQTLHADARFVLAIRDPVWHIASLIKQQRLFMAGEKAHPRAIDHLRRVGHFEFGIDRRPINPGRPGNTQAIEQIQALWQAGEEIEGWARYWALIYAALADTLDNDAALRDAACLMPYERLCAEASDALAVLYAHCGLDVADETRATQASELHPPRYYRPDFTAEEMATIQEITGPVAVRFGYDATRLGQAMPLARP